LFKGYGKGHTLPALTSAAFVLVREADLEADVNAGADQEQLKHKVIDSLDEKL
jgi:hypothetical protein